MACEMASLCCAEEDGDILLPSAVPRQHTAQHSSGNRGGYDDAKLRFGGFNLFNGWRSSDLPTAIAQRHPVRAARLHS